MLIEVYLKLSNILIKIRIMKSHTKYLWFNTKTRREFIEITGEVEADLKESKIKEGFALVGAMHTSAGVFINDADSDLMKDMNEIFSELVPDKKYRHTHPSEGWDNGQAHISSTLIHPQSMIPVTKGNLDLGTWQRIFYAEFDGQRRKRVIIKIIGD
jgi:secondary thiamine-phosphate synthase enzyme